MASFEQMTHEQRAQVMEKVQQEMAAQQALAMFQQTVDKCFAKCIVKPGAKLEAAEAQCLAKCTDRYTDAFQVVSNTIARGSRAKEETIEP